MRLVISRGQPTDIEAVAVLLALDQAQAADRAVGERAAASRSGRPAWRSAARVEGRGTYHLTNPVAVRGALRQR